MYQILISDHWTENKTKKKLPLQKKKKRFAEFSYVEKFHVEFVGLFILTTTTTTKITQTHDNLSFQI